MIWIRRETNSLGYVEFDIMDGNHPVCELIDPPGGYDEEKLEITAQIIASALTLRKVNARYEGKPMVSAKLEGVTYRKES